MELIRVAASLSESSIDMRLGLEMMGVFELRCGGGGREEDSIDTGVPGGDGEA